MKDRRSHPAGAAVLVLFSSCVAILNVPSASATSSPLVFATSLDLTQVLTDAGETETTGMAGIGYLNGTFLVSMWASDVIVRFSSTGEFLDTTTIPGVSGVRAFAWDGTALWAANSSMTLYRLDANLTVADTLITPVAARYLAYEPSLPGWWIGDFNTDLTLIDLAGTVVDTIPASDLPDERYGVALYKGFTSPETALILSHHGPPDLHQLDVYSDGARELADYNAAQDLPQSFNSTLAGGVFVTNDLLTGPKLLTVSQGNPNNFLLIYDLDPSFDPIPMSDGFESGSFSAWSSVVPDDRR